MRHSRQYRTIAQRLIRTLPEFDEIRDAGPRIAYLTSDKEKSKNRRIIFAECFKVEEKYEWCCPYDFFIVVYEPNVDGFNEAQMDILIRHELHHIGVEYKDTGPSFYIEPHDIEEFWEIIDECGLHWSDTNAAG